MIRISYTNGSMKEYEEPIKVKDLIDKTDYNYFACKVNNKLKDFDYTIKNLFRQYQKIKFCQKNSSNPLTA